MTGPASGPFAGFRFHRLLSVPARGEDEPHRLPAELMSALTAAHAELSGAGDPALVFAWQRTAAGTPIQLLVGGRPCFPPAGSGSSAPGTAGPVLYPPGGSGRALASPDVLRSWHATPAWVACSGRPDPLWRNEPGRDRPRRGGFAGCVAHIAEPFVWLVHAVPAPASVVDAELTELTKRIPVLRQRQNSEPDRIAVERAEDRYRDLSRAGAAGTWLVRIAVGAPTSQACRRVAALLCAAGELDGLPYLLTPGRDVTPFDGLPFASRPPYGPPAQGAGGALHATPELLAALTRPPDRELPGLRVVEEARFDVTPEHDGDVPVGEVLDNSGQAVGEFRVRRDTLNRHAFVAGATGAGKSQTVRHLLEGLHHSGVPWLVIEPAKAEYARMAGRVGRDQVAVVRPGAPDAVPLSLNPLEPEPGFPLATHIDLVRALFLAAFQATEPFPQVLAAALARCYRELGWDTALGTSRFAHAVPRHPDLGDLQRTALDVVAGIGYGKDVTDNVRGFIDVRIGSLRLGTPGRFFQGGHPIDMADLMRRNVVLEIEDVGNDQDTAFLIGAILIRLHEHLRVHRDARQGGLRHVTVVEEAHRLLKHVDPASPAAMAIELFTALLAEIRAYGEGIIVAEQIPAKIVPDVIKNTALKIVHRLPAADDRAAVGATMNLDDHQSRHVVSLPPGRAAVFADGMDRPVRIRVPLGEDRENRTTGETTTSRTGGNATATGRVAAVRTARATCPPACADRPCTLRQIAHAARTADDAELALWIEVATAAHVLGYPEPRPNRHWLDRLAGSYDRHLLDCAIGQLTMGAVHRRYPALIEYYQPEDLARHVADRVRAHIDERASAVDRRGGQDGRGGHCDGSEVQWQAGPFRWRDVFAAFAREDHDPGRPHPLTKEWRARGLDLGDGPAREQFLNLQRLPGSRTTDRTAIDGSGDPPEHRRLAIRLSRPGEPMHRFVEATRFLTFTSAWPLHRLYPDEWAAWQDRQDRQASHDE